MNKKKKQKYPDTKERRETVIKIKTFSANRKKKNMNKRNKKKTKE